VENLQNIVQFGILVTVWQSHCQIVYTFYGTRVIIHMWLSRLSILRLVVYVNLPFRLHRHLTRLLKCLS